MIGVAVRSRPAGSYMTPRAASTPPITLSGTAPVTVGGETIITSDAKNNSFPHGIKLSNGDLFIVYRKGIDHFGGSLGVDPGQFYSRRSTDSGATWQAEVPFATEDPMLDHRDVGVSQLADGRVAVTYWLRQPGGPQLYRGCRVRFSSDLGVTWGAPITPADDYGAFSQCPAPLIEVAGVLLMTCYGQMGGRIQWPAPTVWPYQPRSIRMFQSTDGGTTWTLRSAVTDEIVESHEANTIELTSGVLLCLIRWNEPSPVHFQVAFSYDQGHTWTAQTDLWSPTQSAPHVTRLSDGRLVVVYRDHSTPGDEGYIRVGSADALTWSATPVQLYPNPDRYQYGCTIEMSPGQVLAIYGREVTTANSLICQRMLTVT